MRRGRIDIMGEILAAASSGVGKTALVYRTNLNFSLAERYISVLSQNGFISVSRDSPVKYRTTSKGVDFLRSYTRIVVLEKT